MIVNLRPDSETYKHWVGVELNAKNQRMLFIPKGMAHGFQTLADNTLIAYMMGALYHPDAARGVRWNDPAFGIAWRLADPFIISARDASYTDFSDTDSA